MKLIIRFVENTGSGKQTHDTVFEGTRATIGRGTDQSIQIMDNRIPLAHSVLIINGNKLLLKAQSGYNFTVNDRVARSSELQDDDVVDFLGHHLVIRAGTDSNERIVEVSIENSQLDPLRDRFKTRLWQLNFPIRKISWALFALILTVSVVIPSAGFLIGMEFLRITPLPDDSQWLAGKLHPTHAFIGDDCTYCHTTPFTPVRDEDCLTCHLSVNHHFDTKFHGRDYKIGDRCADCHREHSGKDTITRSDQAVCTVCHKNLDDIGLESEVLRSASDFLYDHPSFRVTMQNFSTEGTWQDERRDVWDDEMIEVSNLLFPHDLHLDPEGIDSPDGSIEMTCGDCHVSEKGGLRMKTVTMEQHCANCHQLNFDPATPDRVVPHGSPTELLRTLREYYAFQFLHSDSLTSQKLSDNPPEVREARRPGRRRNRQLITDFIPVENTSVPVTTQAAAFIDDKVAAAANNLFERQTCTICHDIVRDDTQAVPWIVAPVKLTEDWMPMAEFSHNSHRNMQCLGCHEADISAEAADVLMPDIGSCRTCHGGENADDRLQSSCTACHKFHLEDQGPMGALIMLDDDGNMIDDQGNFIDEMGNIIEPLSELTDQADDKD